MSTPSCETLYLTSLHSQDTGSRVCKSRTGGRTFSSQAPLLWNQLPLWVLESDTISTLKVKLKTFLFDKVYSSGSGPEISLSYAAKGCWRTPIMHWALPFPHPSVEADPPDIRQQTTAPPPGRSTSAAHPETSSSTGL